jgi:hypothetical protein
MAEDVAATRFAYELGVPSGAVALGVRCGTTGGVGRRAGTDVAVAVTKLDRLEPSGSDQ